MNGESRFGAEGRAEPLLALIFPHRKLPHIVSRRTFVPYFLPAGTGVVHLAAHFKQFTLNYNLRFRMLVFVALAGFQRSTNCNINDMERTRARTIIILFGGCTGCACRCHRIRIQKLWPQLRFISIIHGGALELHPCASFRFDVARYASTRAPVTMRTHAEEQQRAESERRAIGNGTGNDGAAANEGEYKFESKYASCILNAS